MPPVGEAPDRVPPGLIIAFVILFIAIIGIGILYYQSQEQQTEARVTGDLTSIALLKADQIAAWRGERLGDATVLSQNRLFIDGVKEYLASPDPAGRQKILTLFGQISASYHYQNVQLVNPDGKVEISLEPSDTAISPGLYTQLAELYVTRRAILTDLSIGPDGTPQMYAISPLFLTDQGKTDAVGAVIFTIDPRDYLYPLIQSWPLNRTSAETLLVEREGDHVLYLNDLRFQNNAALNLTIPLSRTDVPAVMAVLGTTGPFTGTDYRGADVISVLEPVPGSPWYIVAKQDTEEAYATWSTSALLIIVLVAGTLTGMFIIIGFVWQRREKYYYRALFETEEKWGKEEQRNRERLETLLRLTEMESAHEQELADFVLDAGCRLTDSHLAFIGRMFPDETAIDITAWSRSVTEDCSVAASPTQVLVENAGIWVDAVRKRQPFIVNEYIAPLTGSDGFPLCHVPITRFASVPIFEGQQIVMVCVVANKESGYTAIDVDNLTLLMQGVWAHLQKKSADEALRQKNTDLEAAYEEITASDEELITNYEDLARNQRALAESEHLYRSLFEHMLNGFAYCRMIYENGIATDFTYLIVNEAFSKLTGLTNVEGRNVSEVIPGIRESDPHLFEVYGRVASTGVPEHFEMFVDALRMWFSLSVYSPQREYFVAVFDVITDRKLIEKQREALIRELEQKNAELERFTFTVSHDLKSPLITIKGFAGLLEDDARKCDPVQLKKDIHRITTAAETMQELLADLLELSQVGKIVKPPEKTGFGTIAREAVDLLAVPLAERGVTVGIVPDLPVVNVDHARIREVMVNLLENAIKFLGDQPDPVIRIGVDMEGETPVFFVQDNGIGIDPRYLERIFNLFEKLDVSRHGTGIGLTISRRIIEVHGGKIWAESEGLGKGTTFKFTLPGVPDTGDGTR
jgi:signal transduction histidine kinase